MVERELSSRLEGEVDNEHQCCVEKKRGFRTNFKLGRKGPFVCLGKEIKVKGDNEH